MALGTSTSRELIQMMLLVIMLLYGWTVVSGGCPRGCYCDEDRGSVECSDLGSFPTSLPTATKSIMIRGGYLNEIPRGALNNVPDLTSISFSWVTIGTIRRRAFYRFAPKFSEFTNVTSFIFSYSHVGVIEQEAFSQFTNVTSFYFSYSDVGVIEKQAFSEFTNVTSFYFSYSDVSVIKQDAFSNFINVTSFYFSYSDVGIIEKDAFSNFTNMTSFYFSYSDVGIIEKEAFSNFTNMTSFYFSYSNVSVIKQDAFSNFINVTSFYFSYSTIGIIKQDAFSNFTNLTSFYLSYSDVGIIEQEAFSNFTNVTSFYISYSTIDTIGSRFLILDDVAYVSIRSNYFGLWAKCAFCGVSATKVAIYNNVVNASQGNAFSGMSGVRSLSIVGNTLPSISVRFFPFDLQTFKFYRNKVKTILCEQPGADYPSTITYSIRKNELMCDCRLNWMWMISSQTLAAQVLMPGFICVGPDKDKQSLWDYFNKVSVSLITPPCSGLKAVNDCSSPTINAGLETSTDVGHDTSKDAGHETSTDAAHQTSTDVGHETSTDTGHKISTDVKASAVSSKAGWISALVVVLTLMIS